MADEIVDTKLKFDNHTNNDI